MKRGSICRYRAATADPRSSVTTWCTLAHRLQGRAYRADGNPNMLWQRREDDARLEAPWEELSCLMSCGLCVTRATVYRWTVHGGRAPVGSRRRDIRIWARVRARLRTAHLEHFAWTPPRNVKKPNSLSKFCDLKDVSCPSLVRFCRYRDNT